MGDIMTTAAPAPSPVAIEAERAAAEVKGAIFVAKTYPRDVVAARERILAACRRPALAEAAQYAYPRGKETVTGPSIRLAEAIAQNWGNFQFGIRELSQKQGESVMEAFAWDVETNTRAVKLFTVPHVRSTKQGRYDLTDPRDIYELTANQGSRRVRACILSLIPGDVVEEAAAECETTLKNSMGAPADVLKKLVDAFQKYGVTQRQIEARLGHAIQATNVAEVIAFKKLYQSILDGFAKAEDIFPPLEEKPAKKTVKEMAEEAARQGQ